jgi:hypothetical protein
MDNIEYTIRGPYTTLNLYAASLEDTIFIKVRETYTGRVLSEYMVTGRQLAYLIDIAIQDARKK